MDIMTLLFIAVALSIDSFAASVALGLPQNRSEWTDITKVILTLSLMQSLFPLIGWLIAGSFAGSIEEYDHWLAFVLLSIVGGQMIYGSIKRQKSESNINISFKTLLMLSFATSIDALITGVSFAFLGLDIINAITTIFAVTMLLTFLGFRYSHIIGKKIGKYSELLAGLILIAIGIKVLIDHTWLS